jgi:hypothetical protein
MNSYGVITVGNYLVSLPGVALHLLVMLAIVLAVFVGESRTLLKIAASVAGILAVIAVSKYLGMLPFTEW